MLTDPAAKNPTNPTRKTAGDRLRPPVLASREAPPRVAPGSRRVCKLYKPSRFEEFGFIGFTGLIGFSH